MLSAALTDPFPETKRECCALLLRLASVCPGGLRSRLGKVSLSACLPVSTYEYLSKLFFFKIFLRCCFFFFRTFHRSWPDHRVGSR